MMFDFADIFTAGGLAALGQVLAIDLLLAGDNAVVLGTVAAGLPAHQRRKVLAIGILAALVLRIVFALVATQLLDVIGLLFAGGLLLLWVAWKLWRELHPPAEAGPIDDPDTAEIEGAPQTKSFGQAAFQVAVADVSMSLDNVLGVTGAARDHPTVLVIGLVVSVALMAVAANLIARIIGRYRWIAYLGVVAILYVSGSMIYHGFVDPRVGVMQMLPR